MANLVGAVAIMLALRFPWPALALRAGFAVGLNVLVYLNNDYLDVYRDLAEGRAPRKTAFLAEHRRVAVWAQLGLVAALTAIALAFAVGLLVPMGVGAGLACLYSARLKTVPYADVLAMAVAGAAAALVAVPLHRPIGWALAVQLGLFSAVFQTIQAIRDRDVDARAGVRTTAVALGSRRSLLLARMLMVISAAYCIAALHRYVGWLIIAAALVPWSDGDTERYWTRVRVVMGVSWVLVLGEVFRRGETFGLLLTSH
jgi:4-hydroxybenzoate polyprenyltransferase